MEKGGEENRRGGVGGYRGDRGAPQLCLRARDGEGHRFSVVANDKWGRERQRPVWGPGVSGWGWQLERTNGGVSVVCTFAAEQNKTYGAGPAEVPGRFDMRAAVLRRLRLVQQILGPSKLVLLIFSFKTEYSILLIHILSFIFYSCALIFR
jgi:hypothetical protein